MTDINDTLNRIELKNQVEIKENTEYDYLYPLHDDPEFAAKITKRKEFYDTRYEKPPSSENIEEISDKLCNADFELAPHQMFVRNFLSFQTPYNGLLLYHGLGSGKTCSAISVSEEMRMYLKQTGSSQRIMIVASPNVQENFYLQLFDERKLQLIDGVWNIRACTGNNFLNEINPMHMKGLSRERIISQVKKIINGAYLFLGYIEFANYISKKSEVSSEMEESERNKIIKQKLIRLFKNRLIIIDEVHNIRMTDDNSNKRVATELMKLVENVQNMRFLLLSATPMYNSYKEIIWILNLLNANDRRSTIQSKDVFHEDGTFKIKDGEEVGKQLFMRKATGYISFVRGENPYTFPFRIWPSEFEPDKTLGSVYIPTQQLNGVEIIRKLELLNLYFCNIGRVQEEGYQYIIDRLKENPSENTPSFDNMESFGYTLLQRPLEALNMVYPDNRLGEAQIEPKEIVGKGGLNRIMKYKETVSPLFRGEFEYKTQEYGRIFSPTEIGLYSGKIKKICDSVTNSEGVILIYSQYIDGGLVPIALALEEMGMRRAGGKSLFKEHVSEPIDAITFKPRTTGEFSQASYVMITGDKALSPDIVADLKLSTSIENKDGKRVKVILISQAGSEGLDFKFIRQVHVLEPWYNMNRIEQIIGRAVRTCSHKDLPFRKRNVQLFLYSTLLSDPNQEAADLYVYRLAELKSMQIGLVSRALKEVAVDCILNFEQVGFTVKDMRTTVQQTLSSGETIDYEIGDRPFSSTCDYMKKCTYTCSPVPNIEKKSVVFDTYNENFILGNNDKIIQRIRDAFRESFFYFKDSLILEINAVKHYPLVQINAALNQLTEDKNEYLVDMYGRMGRLVNIDELYLFQPLELTNKHITLFERSNPIEYKRPLLEYNIKPLEHVDTKKSNVLESMREKYSRAMVLQTIDARTDDWYIFCSNVIPLLEKEGWERSILNVFLIHHIIEALQFVEMLSLLNEMEISGSDEFTNIIRDYIKQITIHANGVIGIQLQNIGKQQLVVLSKSKQWTIAEPEDYQDLSSEISKNINKIIPTQERLSAYIGYMEIFKKDYMVFKIRDMKQLRNSGARCDQASKVKSVAILNVLGETQYTTKTKISRQELCIIQEFLFRKFDFEKRNGKRWFLTPAEVLIVK